MSDAMLLKPPGWLNDSCILHLFLRMKHEILGDNPSVLLMDPSVISFLRLQCDTEEEIKELAEGLALRERNALLVPVNDMELFSGGSSHWSLLCGIRRKRLDKKMSENTPEWYVHVPHSMRDTYGHYVIFYSFLTCPCRGIFQVFPAL